jgi:trk system potassium uptake protein TrkA
VLEFIVKPNSPATKSTIRDLGLPADAVIGGVVRGDRVFIAVNDTQINAFDRVVVFAMPESVMSVAEFFN